MNKDYILMEELLPQEKELHEIAKHISFETSDTFMPKDTTKEQFVEEIRTEIEWYLDMVHPPVPKSVLLYNYQKIWKIKKELGC